MNRLSSNSPAGCGTRSTRAATRAIAGFTLLELMVAVGAMTLIVLVLYGIFDQTQRAMRSNIAQVDVLEGARAATDMLVMDIEQMTASQRAGTTNLHVRLITAPATLGLAGPRPVQDIALQEFFMLTSLGKEWRQIGYLVLPHRTGNSEQPVGTLYRVALSNHVSLMTSNGLSDRYFAERDWLRQNRTNALFQRVIDGVVHFRLRAFDTNGIPIWRSDPATNNVLAMRDPASGPRLDTDPFEILYAFVDDALPAYVELELGIVEPQIFDQLKSMPNPAMAYRHLTNQAARVHLFQQRIPIRTAR
jgi:type II secretory pathway pseudopilin PulG